MILSSDSKVYLKTDLNSQNQFRFDGHTRVHLAAHEVVRVESLGSYDRDPTNLSTHVFELSCKNLLELSLTHILKQRKEKDDLYSEAEEGEG